MKLYFIKLINEPSTWRGLVMVLTSIGLTLEPDIQTTIISAGLGVAGLIGAVFHD